MFFCHDIFFLKAWNGLWKQKKQKSLILGSTDPLVYPQILRIIQHMTLVNIRGPFSLRKALTAWSVFLIQPIIWVVRWGRGTESDVRACTSSLSSLNSFRVGSDLRSGFAGLNVCTGFLTFSLLRPIHRKMAPSIFFHLRLNQATVEETEGAAAFLHLYTLHSSVSHLLHPPPSPPFLLPLWIYHSYNHLPLVSSRAPTSSRGGNDPPGRAEPHLWMRWHPPWCSWREVRHSRMRRRAHVSLPTTHGRGEACGHITVFFVSTLSVRVEGGGGYPHLSPLCCYFCRRNSA